MKLAQVSIPVIDYDAPVSDSDLLLLLNHGWEISEDNRKARLYSEEWSNIQAAVFSTKWWVEENRTIQPLEGER